MANSKTAKDKASGWAFDFDNPDAGQATAVDPNLVGDDAALQRVLEESMRESAQTSQPQADDAPKEEDTSKKAEENKFEDDEAEKERKISKKALIKKIEDSNKELTAQYLKEGLFVYELYAIMIH